MKDLDREVAEALGWATYGHKGELVWETKECLNAGYYVEIVPEWDVMGWPVFSPSTNWEQCGKLIEEYDISIVQASSIMAWIQGDPEDFDDVYSGTGGTAQEAVCRALIARLEE